MTKTPAMKAILINAEAATVKFVEIKDYTDINKFGAFDIFTAVRLNDKGDMVYVDDEGLINGTSVGFILEGYDSPLMGNGVVLGGNDRTGDSADTTFTLEEIAAKVTFIVRFGNKFIRGDKATIVKA